jgi:hypothetical protein
MKRTSCYEGRDESTVKGKGIRNLIYMGVTLGMLIYAVPQLSFGEGMTAGTVFGVAWIAMALLIVAAHLHELLGVEEETRRELLKVKKMKRWQLEQMLQGRRKVLQLKK